MKLNLNQIAGITKGAVSVEEIDSKIYFYRFNKAETEMYKNYSLNFYNKCFASAGIRLEFVTDSRILKLTIETVKRSSRPFSVTSVYVNGELLDRIEVEFGENPAKKAQKTFKLGEGYKTVCIYMPWSADFVIESMELSDKSSIKPVEKKYKALVYGDSITQGYDASSPEDSYACKIADALCAECVNKGIGGEIFTPDLAKIKADFYPDFITVAYGTNEFGSMQTKEDFSLRCEKFYNSLSENYKNSKIFALCPIFRGDIEKGHPIENLTYISDKIKEITKTLPNVITIDCYDFVPKEEKYFSDKVLHPNSSGFEFYYENLISELKKYIKNS